MQQEARMTRVRQQINRLEFVAQHSERLYLNKERTHDRFTLLFGAIEEWIAKAMKEGGAALGPFHFIGLQAKLGSSNDVKFNITNPVAQAMLLHTSLQDRGMVKEPNEANFLEYVAVSGESCLRNPSVRIGGHTKDCEPTDALEAQRADEELVLKAFNDKASVWLLTVQTAGGRVAGTLDSTWVNPDALSSYPHLSWTTFGVLQNRIGHIPLIAPLSIFLDYPKQRLEEVY
jgi:hypothetical protein